MAAREVVSTGVWLAFSKSYSPNANHAIRGRRDSDVIHHEGQCAFSHQRITAQSRSAEGGTKTRACTALVRVGHDTVILGRTQLANKGATDGRL